MNDEQLRQPSDVPAEQTSDFDRVANGATDGGSVEANANGDAGTTAEMVAPQSVDLGGTSAPVSAPAEGIGVDATPDVPAGTTSLVDDAQTADALASFHPEAPVGGTPEPVAELDLDVVGASDGGEQPEPEQSEQPQASQEPQVAAEPEASASQEPEAFASQEQQDAPEATAPPQAQASQDEQAAEGDGADTGEVQVVRSARDPRLDAMAPNASMEDLLKASEQQYRALKHGDVIEGTVMKVDRDEILIDIGSKSEGIIPSHELQSLTEEERTNMQIGDELLVSVVQPENNEGHAILSLDRARQEKSWRDLQKQFEEGQIIQAEVSGYNKGGLLVNLGGVRGFVPSSQVSSIPAGEANKQAEMARLQGRALPLKIIEINRGRNRLILSERQAVQEQREGMRSRLLRELEPGQIRPGTVSSICDFGAFVDIGGADGLIHLSELSWKRVSHPSEVLKVGDRIDVYVLSVDPNERKIALSLKRTQPEPWTTITENYQLGQLVRGTITQLTSFGAFARLEDGIEGLIHVSELAEGRVAHPRNVVKEGDVVELKVIRIDPARKRIGLSLKRVNEDAEAASGSMGGVVDEDTAASTAPTYGSSGIEDETGVAQQDLMPAVEQAGEMGVTPQQATSRQSQFQQQQQRAQQQRPQQRSQQQRPQQPPREAPADEEPMGAMAAAFARLAEQQAVVVPDAADEEEQAQSAPTPAPSVEASAAPAVAPSDLPEAPEGVAEQTEPEAGPEALMPAAADVEDAEEAGEEETATDAGAGAPSGYEGAPSVAASTAEAEAEAEPEAEDTSAAGAGDAVEAGAAEDGVGETASDTETAADGADAGSDTETTTDTATGEEGASAAATAEESAADANVGTELSEGGTELAEEETLG